MGSLQGYHLVGLEELQERLPGEREGATFEETAVCVEESIRDGLRQTFGYMETISETIPRHLEAIKQANTLLRNDSNAKKQDDLLIREERELKLVLQEEICTKLAIRVHIRFLRFCTWLKEQEESGSIKERLRWERCLLEVHSLVGDEIESARQMLGRTAISASDQVIRD